MTPKTTSITAVAEAFFDACETGKGWQVCRAYCTPNATFSAQAEPLLDVKTLAQYTDWMKGILTVLADAHYESRCTPCFTEPIPARAARFHRPAAESAQITST